MEACHNWHGHVSECDDNEEESSDEGPVEESFPLLGHSCKTGNVRYGGTSKTQN